MIRNADSLSRGQEVSLRHLDPAAVFHYRWSTVETSALRCPDFDRLKSAIERFGGNLQPIKVRSTASHLLPFATGSDQEREEFEVVFGYSRLLACAELGLPVFAMVERLSDHELAQQFVSEFCSHPDWRPWRLSQFVKRTIDEGLFPSVRRAAESLAMDVSEVAVLLDLATLPEVVRRAFDNVHFTKANAKKLIAAFQRDPDTITRNAGSAAAAKGGTAASVLAKLQGSPK